MDTTILKDRKVVSEELKKLLYDALLIIKQEGKELSLTLFIQLKTLTFQFLLSYKEYSIANIKEYGLGEILLMRALRFFKLDLRNPDEEKKLIRKLKKTKRGAIRIVRKLGKAILLPFYLLILSLAWLRTKDKRPKEKINKYVKNSYRE